MIHHASMRSIETYIPRGYYLADDTYPKWAILVKTILTHVGQKSCHFAENQESCRKDIKRSCACVLHSRFYIVCYLVVSWSQDQMWEVMHACVIMEKMIIESDRKTPARNVGPYECDGPLAER
jgi:hypothetical protein